MTHCPESCGTNRGPLIEATQDEDKSTKDLRSQHMHSLLEGGDRLFMAFTESLYEKVDATSTLSQHLSEKAAESIPVKSFKDLVPKPYQEFKDIFSKESFDKLPLHKPWDHVIELIQGAKLFSMKVYPMSPIEKKELDSFLEENLKSYHIHPYKFPMVSPVFFVKKKDGSLHFIQDYQKLNDITVKNAYPSPCTRYYE